MTTLVTGGTGFVGGAVVRALLDRGQKVRVLARPTSQTEQLSRLGVEIAYGDILDQPSIEAALDGCDTLYHAAAIYEYWVPDKAVLVATAVEGTRKTMAAARRRGIGKVIYTSTCFTIGEAQGEVGDETTVHRGYFCTAYEEAKYQAEQVVLDYAQQGLPVVTVNPGGVYGPGGLSVTGKALVDALNGKLPMVFPGVACFIYVDDVARGHLLAADRGRWGERYILVGTIIDTAELIRKACLLAGTKPPPVGSVAMARIIAELGEGMARLTRRPPQVARDLVRMLAHGSRADGSKAVRDLGMHYTPLDEGLPKALAWYWEQGLLRRRPQFLQ